MGKFQHIQHKVHINNVLLVKIEGPGAGIPSIITKTCKGVSPTPSFFINQPMGICDIY